MCSTKRKILGVFYLELWDCAKIHRYYCLITSYHNYLEWGQPNVMKGHRRVAIVEDFFQILEQVHNNDCLHAGSKKTYARVRHYSYLCCNKVHVLCYLICSQFVFLPAKKCGWAVLKLCSTCICESHKQLSLHFSLLWQMDSFRGCMYVIYIT